MKIAQICKLIDARKEELFDLLCRLIRINSESFAVSGNEEACARYIYELCQELGLDSEIYSPLDLEGFTEHPDYLPGRNLENRYNVTACWKGMEDRNELNRGKHGSLYHLAACHVKAGTLCCDCADLRGRDVLECRKIKESANLGFSRK